MAADGSHASAALDQSPLSASGPTSSRSGFYTPESSTAMLGVDEFDSATASAHIIPHPVAFPHSQSMLSARSLTGNAPSQNSGSCKSQGILLQPPRNDPAAQAKSTVQNFVASRSSASQGPRACLVPSVDGRRRNPRAEFCQAHSSSFAASEPLKLLPGRSGGPSPQAKVPPMLAERSPRLGVQPRFAPRKVSGAMHSSGPGTLDEVARTSAVVEPAKCNGLRGCPVLASKDFCRRKAEGHECPEGTQQEPLAPSGDVTSAGATAGLPEADSVSELTCPYIGVPVPQGGQVGTGRLRQLPPVGESSYPPAAPAVLVKSLGAFSRIRFAKCSSNASTACTLSSDASFPSRKNSEQPQLPRTQCTGSGQASTVSPSNLQWSPAVSAPFREDAPLSISSTARSSSLPGTHGLHASQSAAPLGDPSQASLSSETPSFLPFSRPPDPHATGHQNSAPGGGWPSNETEKHGVTTASEQQAAGDSPRSASDKARKSSVVSRPPGVRLSVLPGRGPVVNPPLCCPPRDYDHAGIQHEHKKTAVRASVPQTENGATSEQAPHRHTDKYNGALPGAGRQPGAPTASADVQHTFRSLRTTNLCPDADEASGQQIARSSMSARRSNSTKGYSYQRRGKSPQSSNSCDNSSARVGTTFCDNGSLRHHKKPCRDPAKQTIFPGPDQRIEPVDDELAANASPSMKETFRAAGESTVFCAVEARGSKYQDKEPAERAAEQSTHGNLGRGEHEEAAHNTPDTLPEQEQLPITGAELLRRFGDSLTAFEQDEALDFPEIWYWGKDRKKPSGDPSKGNEGNNHGFDDSRGDYLAALRDHMLYRFELVAPLGRGSFGQVFKAFDHKTGEYVALKIVRNKKHFHVQGCVEVRTLQKLVESDKDNRGNVIHMKEHFRFRNHLMITFELLSINLYEFLKRNRFKGLSSLAIRSIGIQLLQALRLLRKQQIVHCDLKPENIALKNQLKSSIKVIDFGSSCTEGEMPYTYIQSRFYRSPEVMLGLGYGCPIDMWSLGCILAELHTGKPLFAGENEADQISCIMEILGPPPAYMIAKSPRRRLYFDSNGEPKAFVNSNGKKRRASSKDLSVLETDDMNFIDFVKGESSGGGGPDSFQNRSSLGLNECHSGQGSTKGNACTHCWQIAALTPLSTVCR